MVTSLSGNQLGAEGHALLRRMISQSGSVDSAVLYNVFRNKLLKLDTNTCTTLLHLLTTSPVNDVRNKSLREELLAWISTQLLQMSELRLAPDLVTRLSQVLHTLTQKNCDASFTDNDQEEGDELENNLLLITCKKPLHQQDQHQTEKIQHQPDVIQIIPGLVENINQMFVSLAGNILDFCQTNQSIGELIDLSTLVFSYLHHVGEQNKRMTTLALNLFNDVLTMFIKISANLDQNPDHQQQLINLMKLLDPKLVTRVTIIKTLHSHLLETISTVIKDGRSMQQNSQLRGSQPKQQGRVSRDGSPDFDSFDNSVSLTTSSSAGDFEMVSQEDVATERSKMQLAAESLILVAVSSRFLDDRTRIHEAILEQLNELLDISDFSENILNMVHPILESLVEAGVDNSILDEIGKLFVQLARRCMTQKIFKHEGIVTLTQCMAVVTPLLEQSSVNTRTIIVKILETLVKENISSNFNRLDAEILSNICDIMDQMRKLGNSELSTWSLHNSLLPQLPRDEDEKIQIYFSLPSFLLSSYATVRIKACSIMHDFINIPEKRMKFLESMLLPVITSQMKFNQTHSVLLASLVHQDSNLSSHLLSHLILLHVRDKTSLTSDQLKRSVKIITQASQDVLQSSLSLCLHHFIKEGHQLEQFPIGLYGFDSNHGQQDFISEYESEVVPLMLLHHPNNSCLNQLSSILNKSGEAVLKNSFDRLSRLFLPGMAAKEFNLDIEERVKCGKLADFVEEKFSKNFTDLIFRSFKSSIAQIFLAVNDPVAMKTSFSLKTKQEPVPSQPLELKSEVPIKIIELLEKCLKLSLWEEISDADTECVLKIVIRMVAEVSPSSSIDKNLRSIHSLFIWLKSFSSSFTQNMKILAKFIIKIISTKVLKLLQYSDAANKKTSMLNQAVLVFMKSLVVFVVEKCSDFLQVFLVHLTSSLVNFITASTTNHLTLTAMEILNYIYLDQKHR